jgi:hypothetical protein
MLGCRTGRDKFTKGGVGISLHSTAVARVTEPGTRRAIRIIEPGSFSSFFPGYLSPRGSSAPGDFLWCRQGGGHGATIPQGPQSITTRLRVCASVVISLTRSSPPNTTWNSAKLLSQKRQIFASSCGFSLLTG